MKINKGTQLIQGLTSGQILFGNSSSGISQDSKLFWDNTNIRLGIGTNSPNAVLEVKDAGNTATVVARSYQDDESVYGEVIANTTSHSGAASGLRMYLKNDGSAWLDAIQNSTAKVLYINPTGGPVAINSTSTTMTQGVDVWGSVPCLLIGSTSIGNRTNAVNKQVRTIHPTYADITIYTQSFNPISFSTDNRMNIGGSSGAYYAATDHNFWTASDNVTTTGTKQVNLDGNGNLTLYNGKINFDYTQSASVGSQTINKVSGSFLMGAGTSSATITNSTVTTTTLVFAFIMQNDATAVIKNVTRSSGSFVVRTTANCTANTKIGFLVINS